MAVGVLAVSGTTSIDTSLTVLSSLGQPVGRVSGVPDLVVAVVDTVPELGLRRYLVIVTHLYAVFNAPCCRPRRHRWEDRYTFRGRSKQCDGHPMNVECEHKLLGNRSKTYGVVPLLVDVVVVRAGPDLQLDSVVGASSNDVETLVAENLDPFTIESPSLLVGAGATLNSDWCAVGVGLSGEALGWAEFRIVDICLKCARTAASTGLNQKFSTVARK